MSRLLMLILLMSLASANTPATAADNQGFIYGTVALQDSTTYTGFIRWDAEEAFWDDLFHSRQSELPWVDHVDLAEIHAERRRQYFETHGMFDRVMWTLNNKEDDIHFSRLFIAQFGYIDAIEIDEDENVIILLKTGDRVPVHGYSNDVSADLIIYPAEGEPEEVEWDDLANISFSQAPAEVEPYARRMYGTVESTEGTFEGFIQWDVSECTSTDIIDGDKREIPLGDIRSLEKNREGTSDIVLTNGESFTMSGTNDVGGGNRGVMVENPAWGRVTVGWKRFISITFIDGQGSGSGRDDFPAIEPLTGTLTDTEGNTHQGRIIFDLDEAWTSDIFNGERRNLEYDIPFGLIASIEKIDEVTCRIGLVSGQNLELTSSQDTGDEHAGVLVFENEASTPVYVPWSRFGAISFTK